MSGIFMMWGLGLWQLIWQGGKLVWVWVTHR